MGRQEMIEDSAQEALREFEADLRRRVSFCHFCGRALYEDELLEHGTAKVCPQCYERLSYMKTTLKRRVE